MITLQVRCLSRQKYRHLKDVDLYPAKSWVQATGCVQQHAALPVDGSAAARCGFNEARMDAPKNIIKWYHIAWHEMVSQWH